MVKKFTSNVELSLEDVESLVRVLVTDGEAQEMFVTTLVRKGRKTMLEKSDEEDSEEEEEEESEDEAIERRKKSKKRKRVAEEEEDSEDVEFELDEQDPKPKSKRSKLSSSSPSKTSTFKSKLKNQSQVSGPTIVYRLLRPHRPLIGLTDSPCGVCPVVSICHSSGSTLPKQEGNQSTFSMSNRKVTGEALGMLGGYSAATGILKEFLKPKSMEGSWTKVAPVSPQGCKYFDKWLEW
jgi:hypothetical protein